MNKREFICGTAAAAGVMASPSLAKSAVATPAAANRLGLEFFTIVSVLAADSTQTFLEKFEVAKQAGYSFLELAGLHGATPEEARRRSEQLGLPIRSYHMGQDISRAFMEEGGPSNQIGGPIHDVVFTDKGCIQVARADLGHVRDMGADWAVMAASSKDCFASTDAVKRLADAFNVCSDLAKKKGLKFSYHTHSIDFTPINGVIPFDVLVKETDPDIRYELDIYWCVRGGADPLKVIAQHKKRLALFHLKDMAKDGSIATPGDGTLDFAAIRAATSDIPDRLYYVERDNAQNPALEAARAVKFLKTQGYS